MTRTALAALAASLAVPLAGCAALRWGRTMVSSGLPWSGR